MYLLHGLVASYTIYQIFCLDSSTFQRSLPNNESPSESSFVSALFPPTDSWKSAKIANEKKHLMELQFSKSFFSQDCLYDTKLEPVYYYPGQDLKLECRMCHVGLVFNGLPKRWAKVKSIDEFIKKGKFLGTKDGPMVEYLENYGFEIDEKFAKNVKEPNFFKGSQNEKMELSTFIQEDGFLKINHIHTNSEGVYFCLDGQSIASLRQFYILIPILPAVQLPRGSSNPQIMKMSTGCAVTNRMYPMHNWKSFFEPIPFDDQQTCLKRVGVNDWMCYDYIDTVKFEGCENPASSCRVPINLPNMPSELALSIYLKYSEWTTCEYNRQSRNGDCFIQLDKPLLASTILSENWKWVQNLNQLSETIEFRGGIPLYSSILAAWLYRVPVLNSCVDEELTGEKVNYEGYDTFFEQVLKDVWNLTKYEEPRNALRFCMRMQKMPGGQNALVGTTFIDVRDC